MSRFLAAIAPLCLIGCTTLATPVAPEAQAGACRPAGEGATVQMTVNEGQVVMHFDRNKAQIRGMSDGQAEGTNGLTVAQLEPRIQAASVARNDGSVTCVNLTAVQLDLGYPLLDVYIASEYPKHSCPHRVVREHELDHVRRHRAALRDHAPGVRAAIESSLARLPPVATRDPQSAVDELTKQLRIDIQSAMAEMDAADVQLNARLDTPASYARQAKRCKRW